MISDDKNVMVIQYNWEECKDVDSNIQLYYKKLHERSYNGKAGDGNFIIISKTTKSIKIQYTPTKSTIQFVAPFLKFSNVHSKSVVSIDVADGGLAVSASSDNKLFVWEARNGTVRRNLEGHVFDVYTCRLFPSGIVVLTAGADMQIKIWDTVTGMCPVTLTGHTAAVTDTAIVDKGKNIISVSKDGSAKLWNCAASMCIAELLKVNSYINCCDITHIDNSVELDLEQDNSERMAVDLEFGTKNKLLALGCEDGKLFVLSLFTRSTLATQSFSSPIMCLRWLKSQNLIVGLGDGSIRILDVRKLNETAELHSHDSASSVLCVTELRNEIDASRNAFIVGREDGLCQYYEDGKCRVQLTGPDCDAIYGLATDANFIYTACRDSVIRKYRIADMDL